MTSIPRYLNNIVIFKHFAIFILKHEALEAHFKDYSNRKQKKISNRVANHTL